MPGSTDPTRWPLKHLAHAVKDANGRSYNRTQYLKQWFEQIQLWADYLDKLAAGGDVIQFKAKTATVSSHASVMEQFARGENRDTLTWFQLVSTVPLQGRHG
jgi:hypothetical protein